MFYILYSYFNKNKCKLFAYILEDLVHFPYLTLIVSVKPILA